MDKDQKDVLDGKEAEVRRLKRAIREALPILSKGCKCDGCDCEMEEAKDILEKALKRQSTT